MKSPKELVMLRFICGFAAALIISMPLSGLAGVSDYTAYKIFVYILEP